MINKSVKFLDEAELEAEEDSMNANLTASQPLMNGHLRPDHVSDQENLEDSLKANSQPHVTISSQHLTAREDRAFRTKIDK